MRSHKLGMVLLLPLLISTVPLYAQSPFSTGSTKGSYQLENGGIIQFNLADQAFKFGYARHDVSGVNRLLKQDPYAHARFVPRYGIELSAKPDSNRGTFTNDLSLAPNAEVTLSLGLQNILTALKSGIASTITNNLKGVKNTIDLMQTQQKALADIAVDANDAQTAQNALEQIRAVRQSAKGVETFDNHVKHFQEDYDILAALIGSPLKFTPPAKPTPTPTPQQMADWATQVIAAATKAQTDIDPDVETALKKSMAGRGPKGMDFDQLNLQASYSYSQYKLVDPTAAFSKQITKQNFHGWSIGLAYNARFEPSKPDNGMTRLLGLSAGVQRTNNSADLTEVTIHNQLFSTQDGTTIRNGETSTKALKGTFAESSTEYLNTDCIVYPHAFGQRIAINLFTRTQFGGSDSGIRPGIAAFLVEKGDPLKVIGGVSAFLDTKGKVGVDIVAGFNF